MRTVRGRGKVHHTVIRRAPPKGWRRNTQTGGPGMLTDCKVEPKGHTHWDSERAEILDTHAYTHIDPPIQTHTNALYPSDQLFIITSQTQDEEETDYKTDGVIESQIGRDRTGRLDSNLNVLSYDCHWHSCRLACSSTICQIIPLTVQSAVKGRPVSIMSQVERNLKKMLPASLGPASKRSIKITKCLQWQIQSSRLFLTVMTKQFRGKQRCLLFKK